MKFLCPNCKAKYQISDEKIAGRTLKMDCRRCNHPIVIRGSHLTSQRRPSKSAPGIASPSRKPGGSHVGPAPARSSRSALGSDFRRNAAGSTPPPPQRPTALDQWHVAINDVPVGPMKRDEVGKKMASGAIKGDSLCWREGFDDWREVRKVPELAALLRRHRPRPAAPPPPKPGIPSPSRPLGRGGAPARPARPPSARIPSPPQRSQASRPAARAGGSAPSNVVPIGGRLGASAAPALEEQPEDFMDEEPTRVGSSFDFEALEAAAARQEQEAAEAKAPEGAPASSPPASEQPSPAPSGQLAPQEEAFDPFAAPPAATPSPVAESPAGIPSAPSLAEPLPERRRRSIPIGAWIAIAGAMAFGVALAVMVGTHFLTQPAQPQAAATTVQGGDETPATGPVEPELDVPEDPEEPPEDETPATDPEEPTADDGDETPASTGGRRRRAGTTTSTGGGGGGSGRSRPRETLTAEQRAALARAGGDDTGPAPIQTTGSNLLDDDEGRGGGRSQLSGDQIRTVVNRNRSRVQQCYEVEARRSGTAPTVRVNAQVSIGSSGTVTRVVARGGSFGNLGTCIERVVRQWHFPRSSGSTTTEIPFVFAGRE